MGIGKKIDGSKPRSYQGGSGIRCYSISTGISYSTTTDLKLMCWSTGQIESAACWANVHLRSIPANIDIQWLRRRKCRSNVPHANFYAGVENNLVLPTRGEFVAISKNWRHSALLIIPYQDMGVKPSKNRSLSKGAKSTNWGTKKRNALIRSDFITTRPVIFNNWGVGPFTGLEPLNTSPIGKKGSFLWWSVTVTPSRHMTYIHSLRCCNRLVQ